MRRNRAERGAPRPAAPVLDLLSARGHTLAVAESLTGGTLAAALTAVTGASAVFRGSVTAYATEVKRDLLGVDAELLAERGAVDPEVARQMATGVRDLLGAEWGAATTGVAGPDPQDGQPVGTVFLAVAPPGARRAVAQRVEASGDREAIRAQTVAAALAALHEALVEAAVTPPGRTDRSAVPGSSGNEEDAPTGQENGPAAR
ncbi:CinA family protein [Streptomyces bohaiensis]|uniref:CinA family protein n=1 Tax=Streptomyces bohaiensis TaxID=1431344 RepID=A0ABX1C2I5_9ACTN|nr:CinA family protein [Streptomyces bohaiensis]NJQ13456.1 CinA family protein [Streptomyces bohaiensis]